MLNFLVGWVKSAKSHLLATNLVSLPDYIRIAESLNPTRNFPVGWVKLAKSQLLAANQVNLPDNLWIAQSLNPTPDLTLSS
jgi:hypothetical protein